MILTAAGSEVSRGGWCFLVIVLSFLVNTESVCFQYLLINYLIKLRNSLLLQIRSSFLFRKYGSLDMVIVVIFLMTKDTNVSGPPGSVPISVVSKKKEICLKICLKSVSV